jgi:hypothetical protein
MKDLYIQFKHKAESFLIGIYIYVKFSNIFYMDLV